MHRPNQLGSQLRVLHDIAHTAGLIGADKDGGVLDGTGARYRIRYHISTTPPPS